MKPTTPTQYSLSPEFFAERRQIREESLADLLERQRQVKQDIEVLQDEIAQLDADEKLAAELVARYEPAIAAELPEKRAKPRRPTPRRPVPSGRPWTPADEVAVAAGDPKHDDALAVRLDRKRDSIVKRRRLLRARSAQADKPGVLIASWREHDPVVQPNRALASEAGGSEFESRQDRQNDIPERAAVDDQELKPSQAADGEPLTEAGGSSEANARLPLGGQGKGTPQTPRRDGGRDRTFISAAGETAVASEAGDTPENISAREAELAAIARFEAEHGVTACPAPGSAELAALPMLTRAYMGRKWSRSEN